METIESRSKEMVIVTPPHILGRQYPSQSLKYTPTKFE